MHNFLPKIFYFINSFDEDCIRKLDKKIAIIYRNYKKKDIYADLLKIKNFCKKDSRKFYLSNNFNLAIKLKLDCFYIPSFNKIMINKEKDKYVWIRVNIPRDKNVLVQSDTSGTLEETLKTFKDLPVEQAETE